MTDFTEIPSQFDQIEKDHPVVFISYSWDSDEHKQWVRHLSDDLRTKYSVNILLDQYNRGGYDLIQFMTKAVSLADRVLIIGTLGYKEKSDNFEAGGVKYEDQLISIELYHKLGSSKFIPVLRQGKFDSSFNPLIETRSGFDMREDDQYDTQLHSLAADIWNNPLNAAPALGPIPSFAKVQSSTMTQAEESPELQRAHFVAEVKRLLSTPNSEIAYTELVEGETKRAYNQILQYANYDFYITPEAFDSYKKLHLQAVDKLIAASIPVIRFGTLKQQKLFINAMSKLCMKPIRNGEVTQQGTEYLHLLASSFLFHAVGTACVKFGYYQLLPLLMKTKVPASNIFSPTTSFNLADMAGINHWEGITLNKYMNQSWYYPFSELLYRSLYPYFEENVSDISDFRNVFCAWEHLFSLMFNYYQCSFIANDWFPLGLFVRKRMDLLRHEDNFYTDFINESQSEKSNWEPLKQGLFDGSFDKYSGVYAKAEVFYTKNGTWG